MLIVLNFEFYLAQLNLNSRFSAKVLIFPLINPGFVEMIFRWVMCVIVVASIGFYSGFCPS
jgi:hypothetical protein